MNEQDKKHWANEVTQAWDKVHKLMGELPTNGYASSELIAKLVEAITKYREMELNRYTEITSKD